MLDTEAIRKRAEAATPGPWLPSTRESKKWVQMQATIEEIKANHENDSAFVAHARTDVPALLDALEEARSEMERTRAAAKNLRFALLQLEPLLEPSSVEFLKETKWLEEMK